MLKVDLLKDSINYKPSEEVSSSKEQVEDFSDLNFTDDEFDFNIPDDNSESSSPEPDVPTSKIGKEAEQAGDSLLEDLGLDNNEESSNTEEPLIDISEEANKAPNEESNPLSLSNSDQDSYTDYDEEPDNSYNEEEDTTDQPQFDFSSTSEDFDSFDDTDFGGGSGKKIFIIIFLIIILGGSGYYFFFMKKDSGTSSEVAQQEVEQTQPNIVEIEKQKKINALALHWKNISKNNTQIIETITKINSLKVKNTYFSMFNYRDNSFLFTVLSSTRDNLALLNRNLKSKLNVNKLKYLNTSSIKVKNNVKLLSDIKISLYPNSEVGKTIDAKLHLTEKAEDIKNHFKLTGLTNIQFSQKNSSARASNVLISSCFLKGKINFKNLSTALTQLKTNYPEVKITKIKIYTKNQMPVSTSSLVFELTFDFHKSNI